MDKYDPVPYDREEFLKDPEVKKLYDELEEEFALAEAIIKKN